MPNTGKYLSNLEFTQLFLEPALVDAATFAKVDALASSKSYIDYGLYAGATADNAQIWSTSDFARKF
jgi:hypothetical protein